MTTQTPAQYRISALGRAFLLMWRGWSVFVPIVAANALIQGVISAAPYSPNDVALNLFSATFTAVLLIIAQLFIVTTSVAVVEGPITWRLVTDQLRSRITKLTVWALILAAATVLGFSLWTVPGIVVLAVTPFVLIAVVHGQQAPLKKNFQIIRQRFWRWLVTALIVTTVALLAYVVCGFVVFFLRGMLGAGIVWLITGLACAWVSVAWALIYKKADSMELSV